MPSVQDRFRSAWDIECDRRGSRQGIHPSEIYFAETESLGQVNPLTLLRETLMTKKSLFGAEMVNVPFADDRVRARIPPVTPFPPTTWIDLSALQTSGPLILPFHRKATLPRIVSLVVLVISIPCFAAGASPAPIPPTAITLTVARVAISALRPDLFISFSPSSYGLPAGFRCQILSEQPAAITALRSRRAPPTRPPALSRWPR